MIVRTVKLKLTKTQESTLDSWLHNLTGVYNWGLRKIELNVGLGTSHEMAVAI